MKWTLILYCFMSTGEACDPPTQKSEWDSLEHCQFSMGYAITLLVHSMPERVFAGKCVGPNEEPDDKDMIYPQERKN